MTKKNKIIIGIVVLLLIVSFTVYKGVNFVKTVVIPELEEEKILDDPDLACLTLQGKCQQDAYSDEQLEKYLKEDVLPKMPLEEAKKRVLRKEYRVLEGKKNKREVDFKIMGEELIRKMYEKEGKSDDEIEEIINQKRELIQETINKELNPYYDRILNVINKLEQEGYK